MDPQFAIKTVVVLAYIAVMIGIGWWCMRKTCSVGDFFIGGRTIGPWVTAMAYGTTYFSAVLFVGFAGKLGWAFGMHTLWIAAGNTLVGVFLAWKLLAIPTREMTERLGAITMPEFLEERYGAAWLRPFAALVVFIFLVPYSASVYQGLAYLFEVNLGIDYLHIIIFMAVLTGIYLVMGGYFAVATTDLIQGFLQVFGVIFMVVLLAAATGLGVFGAAAQASGGEPLPGFVPRPGDLLPGWVMLAALVFMTSVGPWGLPQMTQKFYSIKSRDVVKRGMIVATVFAALISFGAYYCGGLSHHFFVGSPEQMEAGKLLLPMLEGGRGPDFDRLVPQMLTSFTPSWFSVVVLLVVLAASMSTLASLVLVSSAAIAVDLVGARDRLDQASPKGLVLLRVLCGVFVGLSVVIAATRPTTIVTLMSMSWGALAGAFVGPYVWGIFSRRVTTAGGIAGFLAGLATAVGLFIGLGAAYAPVAASAAMIASLVAVPVVSAFTKKMPQEAVARAFGDEPVDATITETQEEAAS